VWTTLPQAAYGLTTSPARLRPLLSGEAGHARLSTRAEVTDATGTLVWRGGFDWSVRRQGG
jgi:hypothetical protein